MPSPSNDINSPPQVSGLPDIIEEIAQGLADVAAGRTSDAIEALDQMILQRQARQKFAK